MKAGWTTTEFWTAWAGVILGVLVMLGVIEPGQVEPATGAVGQIAGGVITLVSIFGYLISRTIVKKNGG